jgi:hypothetical protein
MPYVMYWIHLKDHFDTLLTDILRCTEEAQIHANLTVNVTVFGLRLEIYFAYKV